MADEIKSTGTETTVTETQQNDTPSVESLMAQLAEANARADRNKLELDKALKENGTVKKALREKQTEEERLSAEQAEAQRIRDEEFEATKAELNKMKAVGTYKIAFDSEKVIEDIIDAISCGEHSKIAKIIASDKEKAVKEAVAEAEQTWLKGRPRVQHGTDTTMSKEDIMSISDPIERQSKIAQNIDLFRKQR